MIFATDEIIISRRLLETDDINIRKLLDLFLEIPNWEIRIK